jgi:uncharacterized protein (DUF1778 family)
MSDVRRYVCQTGVIQCEPPGELVLASDYDALAAELEAAQRVASLMTKAAGEHAEEVVRLQRHVAECGEKIERLFAELDEAKRQATQLRAQYVDCDIENGALIRVGNKMARDMTALRAALNRWGIHDPGCNVRSKIAIAEKLGVCDCGLDGAAENVSVSHTKGEV